MKNYGICPWSQISHLKKRIASLEDALKPSSGTKFEYIGEIKQNIVIYTKSGKEITHSVTIDWTTMKDMMKMILNRADRNS